MVTLAARLEGDLLDGEGLDFALLRAGDFDLPLLRDLDLDLDLDFLAGDFALAMAFSLWKKGNMLNHLVYRIFCVQKVIYIDMEGPHSGTIAPREKSICLIEKI